MAWITTLPDAEADGPLRELYDRVRDPQAGEVDEIMRIHSLHPAGLEAHLALYNAAMRGTQGLRKLERELIALVVSLINSCHY